MKSLPATFKIPRQPDFPDVTFLRTKLGPLPEQYEVTITPYDVLRWARLHDDTPSGPNVVPWILYFSSMNLLGHEFGRERHLPAVPGSSGFARYRLEFLAPIPVGSTVVVGGEVTDKYSRRGRAYIEWRLDAWLNGELVQRHWKSWAFPALPEELAGYPERPSEPQPEPEPAIERFGPLNLPITIERLIDFEGPIPLNSHNDVALAEERGMPGPLAQGQISFGLICRLLWQRFGDQFHVGSSLDVRFIRPVYAGQTTSAYGEILGEADGRVRCRIWAENNDGMPVIVGTAQVPAG